MAQEICHPTLQLLGPPLVHSEREFPTIHAWGGIERLMLEFVQGWDEMVVLLWSRLEHAIGEFY